MTTADLKIHMARLEEVRKVFRRALSKGIVRYGDVEGAQGTLSNLAVTARDWADDLKEQADRLTEDLKAGRIRARG